MMAFAAVVGLIGVHAALLDQSVAVVAPVIALSAGILIANGTLTRRSWVRAHDDDARGTRTVHAGRALVLAAATLALAIASMAVLVTGAPPS